MVAAAEGRNHGEIVYGAQTGPKIRSEAAKVIWSIVKKAAAKSGLSGLADILLLPERNPCSSIKPRL